MTSFPKPKRACVLVFGRSGCGYTQKAVDALTSQNISFAYLSYTNDKTREEYWQTLNQYVKSEVNDEESKEVNEKSKEIAAKRLFPTVVICTEQEDSEKFQIIVLDSNGTVDWVNRTEVLVFQKACRCVIGKGYVKDLLPIVDTFEMVNTYMRESKSFFFNGINCLTSEEDEEYF
jgi:glutaredoxin